MRKILLSASLLFGSMLASAQCNELFISEYLEGTGNNKAIEVYNPTANPINLADYALVRYQNGGTTPFAVSSGISYPAWIVLAGTIPAYGTHVAVLDKRDPNGTGNNVPADQGLISVGNAAGNGFYCFDFNLGNALYFNGDDAVVLIKNINTTTGIGTFIDIVGKIGIQPTNGSGTFSPVGGWTAESNFVDGVGRYWSRDNTMRRKATIEAGWIVGVATAPDNAFNPSVQWDSVSVNNFTGLGSHTCNCFTSGLEVLVDDNSVRAFPNPVMEGSSISVVAESEILGYEVIDMLGRVVKSNLGTVASTQTEITLQEKGMYNLRVTTEKSIVIRRIVVY